MCLIFLCGGRGIGEATCEVLSELGASVVVVDINKDTADRTLKSLTGDVGNHISLQCDVSKSVEVQKLFDDIAAHYGPDKSPTVLINNVGVTVKPFTGILTRDYSKITSNFEASSVKVFAEKGEIWDKTLEINLKSMFLMTREFIKRRVEFVELRGIQSADSAIVNLSSVRAVAGFGDQPEYNASKGGILSLTKSTAKEWGPKGFRCNAVLPGLVDTPLAQELLTPEQYKDVIAENVLGRVCKPREVAQAIAYLASDFSSFVTGTTLQVSGGQCM